MRLHEYQQLALKTCKDKQQDTLSGEMMQLLHGCIGVTTEIAELIDDTMCSDRDSDHPNIKAEIGDICWYIAIALDSVCFDMEDIEFIQGDLIDPLVYLVPAGGHLNDVVKRVIYYEEELDSDKIVFWCSRIIQALEQFCRENSINFNTCLELNIEKLRKRYGDKFSELKAIQRDEKAERKVFED